MNNEKEIILYHKETCPQCKMVEMLLKKDNIKYKDVTDDETMINLNIQHVPTLFYNGTYYKGKDLIVLIKSGELK